MYGGENDRLPCLFDLDCNLNPCCVGVATLSQATRRSHLGFSLNIPGNSTATVIGLQAGVRYRFALYQYSSDARWVGHTSSVTINGEYLFSTKITDGSEPSVTDTFVAQADGTADFLFNRVGEHRTVLSGLTVSKICTGLCMYVVCVCCICVCTQTAIFRVCQTVKYPTTACLHDNYVG